MRAHLSVLGGLAIVYANAFAVQICPQTLQCVSDQGCNFPYGWLIMPQSIIVTATYQFIYATGPDKSVQNILPMSCVYRYENYAVGMYTFNFTPLQFAASAWQPDPAQPQGVFCGQILGNYYPSYVCPLLER